MKNIYENLLDVSPQNPCVVAYEKSFNYGAMPQMHYHPYYEVYFLVSGQRKYFYYNKIFSLVSGNVIIIKPNEAHKSIPIGDRNSQAYERYLLNIDETMFSKIERYNKDIKSIFKKGIISLNTEKLAEMIGVLERIKFETGDQTANYGSSVRNLVERILIDLCMQEECGVDEKQFSKNDIRIQEATEYIIKNHNKNITLKECADICFMGESNFTKVFHNIVGVNFKTYVNSVRIEKACELLTNSDLTISQISGMVGFENSSYFANVFKKNLGISPKDYRNMKSQR
ncbi:MAG: AraC family transcriptional regulator [Clostridia bacterium]|nr:AraC family transcriptional regulator [Clostridia bacterium]